MDGDPLNATGHRWYVVHTKPRQELLAAGMLESTHAVAVYLPQVRQPHGPARRWTTLFPGYLFLHADLRAAPASEIDKTPGVIRLVAFDGQPQPVPDGTIEALRRRVDAASFADDQLDLIKTAATGNLFSADQVVSLMKACTYEDTRIEVAALLYTQLTDPDRAYLIYDGFTYASSKKTLRQRLGQ